MVLAVGCHPHDAPFHHLGVAASCPNSIQLWEVPLLSEGNAAAAEQQQSSPLPRLSLIITHNGGMTWQCKWCPNAKLATAVGDAAAATDALPSDVLPRLGLLSAVLGDGTVHIWSIPQLHSLQTQGEDGTADAEAPVAASPTPLAFLSSHHLSGSLPCRVDWLPTHPFDLMLIGCWDGTVAVAKLEPRSDDDDAARTTHIIPPGSNTIGGRPLGLRLLCHFPADAQPIRVAKWLPAAAPVASDLAHRFIFLTAGHEGIVKVWDYRDQFNPAFFHQLTTTAVMDAAWSFQPLGLMTAMEDSSLRGLLLDAGTIKSQLTKGGKPPVMSIFRGRNTGALMAVAAHPRGTHVAFAGEDGVVGLAEAQYHWDARKRSDHVPLSAMCVEDGALKILSRADLEEQGGNGGLYTLTKADDKAHEGVDVHRLVPDAAQILHCVAWGAAAAAAAAGASGSGGGGDGSRGAVWLAVGGAAGLVRCQLVPQPA